MPGGPVEDPLVDFAPFEACNLDCLLALLLRDRVLQLVLRKYFIKHFNLPICLPPSFVLDAFFKSLLLAFRLEVHLCIRATLKEWNLLISLDSCGQ